MVGPLERSLHHMPVLMVHTVNPAKALSCAVDSSSFH